MLLGTIKYKYRINAKKACGNNERILLAFFFFFSPNFLHYVLTSTQHSFFSLSLMYVILADGDTK